MRRKNRSNRNNPNLKAGRITSSFRRNTSEVVKFKEASFGLLKGANFSDDKEDSISKKALVLVEGEHTDNSGKKHSFSKDDIEWFAEATNEFLEEGGRVPWQSDHNKSQSSNIGDLEDLLITKTITPEDLPDPKLGKKLLGKLGLFATELVGKGKDVVEQIRSGRIKTLSPGIDIKTGIIREISATPTPAIVGMSIFSAGGAGCTATNWEEAESLQKIDDEAREEYDNLADTLWSIAINIINASEEEIADSSKQGKVDEAINGFAERFYNLLGVKDEGGTGSMPGKANTEEEQMTLRNRQGATQPLSLSENLNNLSSFKRGKTRGTGIGIKVGRVGATAFYGKAKGHYGVGGGLVFDARSKKVRRKEAERIKRMRRKRNANR